MLNQKSSFFWYIHLFPHNDVTLYLANLILKDWQGIRKNFLTLACNSSHGDEDIEDQGPLM